MTDLFTIFCAEINIAEYETVQNIILHDKYESLFTDDTISKKLITIITNHDSNYLSKKLMIKYKIKYDNIINNLCFLNHIYRESDIAIINKYDYSEQQIIIKALVNNVYYSVYPDFLIKIIHLCNYSVKQWWDLYTIRKFKYVSQTTYLPVIFEHIQHLLYRDSLRNAWITSCITI